MINKSVKDISNSRIDNHEIIIENKILKYLDNKTQSKEKEIIEKALNNKKNPYFKLISENAKMINDIIIEFEKTDYILSKERVTNFNKSINETIISFVQAIELIDDLNYNSDTTITNIKNYNKYLYDLNFNLENKLKKEDVNND